VFLVGLPFLALIDLFGPGPNASPATTAPRSPRRSITTSLNDDVEHPIEIRRSGKRSLARRGFGGGFH
jgi:hypothetical protein